MPAEQSLHTAIGRVILRGLPVGHDVDVFTRLRTDGGPVEAVACKCRDVGRVGAGKAELGGVRDVFVNEVGDGLDVADGKPVEL